VGIQILRFGPELSVGAGEQQFIGDQPVHGGNVGAELCGSELFLECDDRGVCFTYDGAGHVGRSGFGHGNKE